MSSNLEAVSLHDIADSPAGPAAFLESAGELRLPCARDRDEEPSRRLRVEEEHRLPVREGPRRRDAPPEVLPVVEGAAGEDHLGGEVTETCVLGYFAEGLSGGAPGWYATRAGWFTFDDFTSIIDRHVGPRFWRALLEANDRLGLPVDRGRLLALAERAA